MKNKKFVVLIIALVFILGAIAGLGFLGETAVEAKGEQLSAHNPSHQSEHFTLQQTSHFKANALASTMAQSIPVQGRLTTAAGTPLNGDIMITFRLYEVEIGGTAFCTDTHSVPVTNGLFSTVIQGCSSDAIYGQQIYLGIQVSSDSEMTPRQPIHPVPYALSLVPGAIINNLWGGHGLEVKSNTSGYWGTALWVENTNSDIGGIGVWSTVAGDDASIIASNNGTGALFKGFGADGGEDEFRINNDGAIETKAISYVFISGNSFQKWASGDTTRWQLSNGGGAYIYSGSVSGGERTIAFPVTLPAQLYGQPVKIESITVYYKTSNGTNAYITSTTLWRQVNSVDSLNLFSNDMDRTSTTPSSYNLYPSTNNVLHPSEGGLLITIGCTFANDSDSVLIGAIRIQLGHHDYY